MVEDLRRQILLAFWVVEELPTTFSYGKPGHALPLTYNHATCGGPLVFAGIKGRDTGPPKRAKLRYTLLQHDWCGHRTVTMEAPVSQCTHYEEMKHASA